VRTFCWGRGGIGDDENGGGQRRVDMEDWFSSAEEMKDAERISSS